MTLAQLIKKEAKELQKSVPDLTKEQAEKVVRICLNRYTGHANFHEVIMNSKETK